MTGAAPLLDRARTSLAVAIAAAPGGELAMRVANRFLPRGALLLATLTLVSYVMGLLRDRTLARTFGAGIENDAFIAAAQIPELALDVLVASGLAAPFVPIFTGLAATSRDEAVRFGQTILTLAVVVMGIGAAILFVVAPTTASLILDARVSAAGRELYVNLFRAMAVSQVAFAAALALGEILVAERRFFWYAIALPTYNAGILLGTALLGPSLGIFGAAVGAVVGALAYLACRVIGVRRAAIPLRPRLAIRMPAVREFVRLMIPKTLSQPIDPLTFQVFTRVATSIGPGVNTAVNLARNFQSVPVSIVGAQFALAAFPSLSVAAADGDRRRFLAIVRANAISIGLVTGLGAIGLIVVGRFAVRLFLGGGAFDDEAVDQTSTALEVFALSVPLESLTYLLARAIYATRNTILPVLASLAGFAVTVAGAFALAPSAGIVAIPLAFGAGMAIKLVLLALALAARVRGLRPTADA
jgi:putative peptidoglycan lipid II flippase